MSWLLSPSTARHLFYGILIGFSLSIASTSVISAYRKRRDNDVEEKASPRPIELRSDEVLDGLTGLIGNTPLVRINSLSNALGVEILGKAEYLNPGGSVKDRVALQIIDNAEREGLLRPYTGSRIFEGTSGSTGISIATIARARGYDATIVVPDDVSLEKVKALEVLGANVEIVRPASIVDRKQYVNLAREYALDFTNGKTRASVLANGNGNGNGNGHALVDDEEESLSRPRGFFCGSVRES
jgi:cysteine synthase A